MNKELKKRISIVSIEKKEGMNMLQKLFDLTGCGYTAILSLVFCR
jgi:hypothetical protein